MAYYALWKWFSPWCKIPHTDWIVWYKNHLAELWWESLEEEEKEVERQAYREKQKKKEEQALQTLSVLKEVIESFAGSRRYW